MSRLKDGNQGNSSPQQESNSGNRSDEQPCERQVNGQVVNTLDIRNNDRNNRIRHMNSPLLGRTVRSLVDHAFSRESRGRTI